MIKSLVFLFISLLIEIILFSFYIKFLKKKEVIQTVRELGPKEHFKKNGTPTSGGILIIIFTIINFIGLKLINMKNFKIQDIIILLTIIGYGLIGLLDDLKIINNKHNNGLSPKIKLILEMFLTTIIIFIVIRSTETIELVIFNFKITNKLLLLIFYPFYIMGWSNSYNITDGIDGLASSLTFVLMIGVFILGKISNNEILILISLSLFFSVIGFLLFNANPAMLFMGNTGSHSIGSLIGVLAILTKTEFIFFVMGFVFIFETISVILQVLYFKKTNGKRLFKMAPFHHHLELSGYSEKNVDYFLILIEIIFVIIGIILWGI